MIRWRCNCCWDDGDDDDDTGVDVFSLRFRPCLAPEHSASGSDVGEGGPPRAELCGRTSTRKTGARSQQLTTMGTTFFIHIANTRCSSDAKRSDRRTDNATDGVPAPPPPKAALTPTIPRLTAAAAARASSSAPTRQHPRTTTPTTTADGDDICLSPVRQAWCS